MSIINLEAYDTIHGTYVNCEAEVDLEAHGVAAWKLKSIDGRSIGEYGHLHDGYDWVYLGIDPITYDQVDAAARVQIRGER